MASDAFEHAEIDRLVKELTAPLKPVAPAAPPVAPPVAPTPGRYTTARVLMPAVRTERRHPFAFASALRLPTLPTMAFPALPTLSLPALNDTQWGARLFVAFGVLLAAAMPYWPSGNAWSWGLLMYLSAIDLLVVTGIWGAKLTWDARLPAAHTVAIGIVCWGLALLAAEAVPRISYAASRA